MNTTVAKIRFSRLFYSDLVNVQCAFDETEEAVLQLENMIETIELREKELEHRFQLTLYQKKREDELDDLKGKQSLKCEMMPCELGKSTTC